MLTLVGPVPPESDAYVSRDLDVRILRHLNRGELVNLTGGRQTGKTSLLLRLRTTLGDQGAASAYVDCAPLGELHVDDREWYRSLGGAVNASLLPPEVRERAPMPPDDATSFFGSFLIQLAKAVDPRKPLVLLLDEITGVPPSLQKQFFTAARALFSGRMDAAAPPEASRILFVFSGSFDPDRLMLDSDNSPFNVAQTLLTSDFDFDIATTKRVLEMARSSASPEEVWAMTGGQPYLTNRVAEMSATDTPSGAMRDLLRSNDPHVSHVARKLRSDGLALSLACEIRRGRSVPFAPAIDEALASLSFDGIVKSDDSGNAQLTCEVYGRIVDLLCGIVPTASTEESPDSLSFMPDGVLKRNCSSLMEIAPEISSRSPVLAAVCAGIVLESALLVRLESCPKLADAAAKLNAEVDAARLDGRMRIRNPASPLEDASLAQMIELARLAELITKPASQVSHAVRDWRNLVHPKQLRVDFPDGVKPELSEAAVATVALLLTELA